MRALACPASLKGVLTAAAAAAALAEGLRAAGADAVELPVADGGEGTAEVLWLARGGAWHETVVDDAFGTPRRARWLALPDGPAVVESAAAVPLDPDRLEPLAASSRGFGELVEAALASGAKGLVLGLGGTATMDAGAWFLDVLTELPVPALAVCDVTATLAEAPSLFGPQKGAGPAEIAELERRFVQSARLASIRHEPRTGAAGGLGAALAFLGAELVSGAAYVLDAVGFDPSAFGLVVTGEGRVDATTALGKAPGEIVRRAGETRCVVFGGVVEQDVPGAETVALSGDPSRAREDLVALGRELV